MQCLRRPVPSKTALRLLRHLAYSADTTTLPVAASSIQNRKHQRCEHDRRRPRLCTSAVADTQRHRGYAHSTAQVLRRGHEDEEELETFGGSGDKPNLNFHEAEEGKAGGWSADGWYDVPRPEAGSAESQLEQSLNGPLTEPSEAPVGDAPSSRSVSVEEVRQRREDLLEAYEHWKEMLSTVPTDKEVWLGQLQALHDRERAAAASEGTALLDDPLSPLALIESAVQARLPDLVLHVCRHLVMSKSMSLVAPEVIEAIASSPPPYFLPQVIDLLNTWVADEWSNLVEPYTRLGIRTLQMRLVAMASSTMLEDHTAMAGLGVNKGRNALVALFTDIVGHEGQEAALEALKAAAADCIEGQRIRRAHRMFQSCLNQEALDIDQAAFADLARWLLDKTLNSGDQQAARNFVQTLDMEGSLRVELTHRLWASADNAFDLLQTFATFDLQGSPNESTRALLFDAIVRHMSPSTTAAELSGTRARMWVGVVAQSWEASKDPHQFLRSFWRLQHALGRRTLSPILYDTALRICRRHGLGDEQDELIRHQQDMAKGSANSLIIARIMQAARQADWVRVKLLIAQLQDDSFAAMQTQSRVQLFDPLLDVFASKERPAKEIYDFANDLFNHICGVLPPLKAVLLMIESFIRSGRVDVAEAVHEHANETLEKPLQLNAVDAKNLLSAYYYAFRPSTQILTFSILQMFDTQWNVISRIDLPLLLLSASFESKNDLQSRTTETIQAWVKRTLDHLDDQAFRRELMEEASSNLISYTGRRSLTTSDRYQTRDDVGSSRSIPLSEPMIYEKLRFEAPAADVDDKGAEDPDEAVDTAETAPSTALRPPAVKSWRPSSSTSATTSASTAWNTGENAQAGHDIREEDRSSYEYSRYRVRQGSQDTPSISSREAHLNALRTKALMHAADSQSRSHQVSRLLERSPLTNPIAPSANLISLAASSVTQSSPTLSTAIHRLAERTGSDLTLTKIPHLVSALDANPPSDSGNDLSASIERLKGIITADYVRVEDHGHVVNHSLATGLANIMLRLQRPGAAVELVRHAFHAPHAALVPPGLPPLLALLRAYIRLGRADGVQWVVDVVLARNERVEKNFLTALKNGRNQIRAKAMYLPEEKREEMVALLQGLLEKCQQRQKKQIRRAAQVGRQLARYIVKFAEDAPRMGMGGKQEMFVKKRSEEGTKGGGGREKGVRHSKFAPANELWTDAAIVATLCGDIVTLGQRTKGLRSRRAVGEDEVRGGQHLRLPRLLKAADERRAARRWGSREVKVEQWREAMVEEKEESGGRREEELIWGDTL